MKKVAFVCCWAILLSLVQSARADEVKYRSFMDGASENPATGSTGIGTALVTMDLDLVTMHVEASFSDLLGTTTNSHIHCCVAPPGNVGVATTSPTFTGFPMGVMSGTYDHVFDMTLASSYNAPFVTANGGTPGGAYTALLSGLAAGRAYFNIHSSRNGGGEIRGFLHLVPEPASLVLCLLYSVPLCWMRRRRR